MGRENHNLDNNFGLLAFFLVVFAWCLWISSGLCQAIVLLKWWNVTALLILKHFEFPNSLEKHYPLKFNK